MSKLATDQAPPAPLTLRASAVMACTASLTGLVQQSPAIRFCCLSTADGRLIAKSGEQDDHTSHRIAVMAASFLTLSESFAKEGAAGRCTHTTLSAEHGTIVVVRAPTTLHAFVLSVGANLDDNLATVLRLTLDTAEKLARHLG